MKALKFLIATFGIAGSLQAAIDISNLNNCTQEVRMAAAMDPCLCVSFAPYKSNYGQLLTDLKAADLPFVYQQAAVTPLVQFLEKMGEAQYLNIFNGGSGVDPILRSILPDAALAILNYKGPTFNAVTAFQEVVSDLYDNFLSDESRVGKQTGKPIDPPDYGVIPPLVIFGDPNAGPYTWPGDTTRAVFGMGCGIVSLPPAQMRGGLLAWTALGHETSGHDITHADQGLLSEIRQNVYNAVLQRFNSMDLANYWATRIDETTSDVCGYMNLGPTAGVGMIGYFRALVGGKLRSGGYVNDPHPIDLLRGYLAASVVKYLNFQEAQDWSNVITTETNKDQAALYLIDSTGKKVDFPVSLPIAIASTDTVAKTIMQVPLNALQGHSLQELQDWKDVDQMIVDNLVTVFKVNCCLPTDLQGPGFYASYVVAAATQAAMQMGAKIPQIFNEMQGFLSIMHLQNPTWSKMPSSASLALLSKISKEWNEKMSAALEPVLWPTFESL